MKNIIKKILCMGLAIGMITVSAMADFVDMPEDPTAKAVLESAVANGLLNGVGNDRIAPYETITRAQMGAIISRAMGAVSEANISSYTDVSKDKWYYTEMARAVRMGAFQGDGAGRLNPDAAITFQEAFLVLARVFDLRYVDDNCLDNFADKATVATWAEDGVKKIISGGYWTADLLRAGEPINRLEFATLMNNLVTTYIDTPGTYTTLPKGNTLIRCDGVIIDGITVDNYYDDLIIIGDGVKNTSITNADGVHAVVRGGDVKLSGKLGVVRTLVSGTSLTPDLNNIGVKTYPDGSSGIMQAWADGSYINIQQVVGQ